MSISEVDSRNIAISMRKSVENLVISSQEVIGQSISQALNCQIAHEIRNVSRSPSPSPRAADSAAESADNDKASDGQSQVSCSASADSGSVSISDSFATAVAGAGSGTLRADRADPSKGLESVGGRAKKKSWYNSLYPTYKSKSDDFKRIFKDLPEDERLIVDYSCALQRDILVHGRLYASQHYLCFRASIFGWETSLCLRWKEVTAITKEKTALVIPNAILICTDAEKNFLTSFSGRDKAYLMLFRIWQNALMDQPMSSQEIWQWVHTCYGEELGFNSDEEGYPREADEPAAVSDGPAEVFVSYAGDGVDSSSMEASGAADGRTSRSASRGRDSTPPLANGEADAEAEQGGEAADALPTDMSDSTDTEPEKHNSGDSEKCTASHDGKLLLEQEFPFPVDQMFTMIFTNSKFSVELLAARGIRDYVQAEWRAAGGLKRRQVSYTQQITTGPLGPKEVHVTETQVVNKCSKAGSLYSIEASSENSGIPYADYFSVEVHYCLQRAADCATRLRLYVRLHYKKTMWQMVKGFVEKNTIDRLEEFARLLESRLLAEAEGGAPAKRQGRRRRRHTAAGTPEPTAAVATKSPPVALPPRASISPPQSPTSSWLVAILVLLLAINGLLYWKLYYGEQNTFDFEDLQSRLSLAQGATVSSWARALEAHSRRQRGELRAWRDALAHATAHLAQTEEALTKLLESIKPSLERAQEEARQSHREL